MIPAVVIPAVSRFDMLEANLARFDHEVARLVIIDNSLTGYTYTPPQDSPIRRVDILRLRFQEDKPIRDIASEWGIDAAAVHKEYARARQEFKEALLDVVAFHHPGSPGEVERECAELLGLLSE